MLNNLLTVFHWPLKCKIMKWSISEATSKEYKIYSSQCQVMMRLVYKFSNYTLSRSKLSASCIL